MLLNKMQPIAYKIKSLTGLLLRSGNQINYSLTTGHEIINNQQSIDGRPRQRCGKNKGNFSVNIKSYYTHLSKPKGLRDGFIQLKTDTGQKQPEN